MGTAIEVAEANAAAARARAAGDVNNEAEDEAVDPYPLVDKRVTLRYNNKRNPLHGKAGRVTGVHEKSGESTGEGWGSIQFTSWGVARRQGD